MCANSLVVQPYTWLVGRQRALSFTIHRKRWIDRNKMQNAMGRASMCLLLSSPFFLVLSFVVHSCSCSSSLPQRHYAHRIFIHLLLPLPPASHLSNTPIPHRACFAHSATSITPSSTTTARSGSGCTTPQKTQENQNTTSAARRSSRRRKRVHRRGERHTAVQHDAPLRVLALHRQHRLLLLLRVRVFLFRVVVRVRVGVCVCGGRGR